MSGRFEAAGSLMSGKGSRGWAGRAELARDRHGELRGYWSTAVGLSPPGDRPVYRQRLMWGYGYASCVLTKEMPDDSLALLDEYEGCSENAEGPPPGLPASATFVAAEPPGFTPPPPGDPPVRD